MAKRTIGPEIIGNVSELAMLRNASELLTRSRYAALLGQTFGGARDLYQTLGYNKTLLFQDYWNMFRRGRRIISAPVESTWRGGITLSDGDSGDDTPFETAWKALDKEFKIVPKLVRLDKLVGLGEFAVLLMGFNDGLALDQPLGVNMDGVPRAGMKLLYLQPYHQGSIQIVQWDNDPTSARFGKPVIYQLGINRVGLNSTSQSTSQSIRVHFSRIIHVADGLIDNDVIGTPRLESCYNGLSDLEKIVGGSAEMYWQGALGGKAFSAKEGASFQPGDREAMQTEIDEYVNGMRRYMKLQNMDVQDLSPSLVDPKASVEVQLDLISGDQGIPKRILIGSERGELASSQDESNWNNRIKDRRDQYAEPFILRPLVDLFIQMGVLPAPKEVEYDVKWVDLWSSSDKDKADVANINSTALKNYITAPGLEQVMPFEFFLEKYLNCTQKDIEKIKQMLKDDPPEEPLTPEEIAGARDAVSGAPVADKED